MYSVLKNSFFIYKKIAGWVESAHLRFSGVGGAYIFEDVDKSRRSIPSSPPRTVVCLGLRFYNCESPAPFPIHQHLQPWSPNRESEWPTRNTAKTSPREETSNHRKPSLMIRCRWDHGFWHCLSLLSVVQQYFRSFRAFEWACNQDQWFLSYSLPVSNTAPNFVMELLSKGFFLIFRIYLSLKCNNRIHSSLVPLKMKKNREAIKLHSNQL